MSCHVRNKLPLSTELIISSCNYLILIAGPIHFVMNAIKGNEVSTDCPHGKYQYYFSIIKGKWLNKAENCIPKKYHYNIELSNKSVIKSVYCQLLFRYRIVFECLGENALGSRQSGSVSNNKIKFQ